MSNKKFLAEGIRIGLPACDLFVVKQPTLEDLYSLREQPELEVLSGITRFFATKMAMAIELQKDQRPIFLPTNSTPSGFVILEEAEEQTKVDRTNDSLLKDLSEEPELTYIYEFLKPPTLQTSN